jgi:hypothetical protein
MLDKGQVFAMFLNRRKVAEKTRGLIRRKFLIDACATYRPARDNGHTFETMSTRRLKRVVHHQSGRKSRNPCKTSVLRKAARRAVVF